MKKQKKSFQFWSIIIITAIIIAYVIFALVRPILKITAETADIPSIKSTAAPISWPQYGESAVGAQNDQNLVTFGEQKSVAIASIAKTILALAVLEKKPLQIGEQGPSVTMTQKDEDLFNSYMAQNGSVMPVQIGDNLSEYQLLQGLLLPSGDNIADTLANWVFGSVDNYLAYANNMIAKLGLKETHMADAGGLSPQTVSSAQDLITIGKKVMENPVLAEIVGQSKANLPVIGTASNYNTLLGQDGVIGIKTGNTDEAGGCLLFAYKKDINGQDVNIIGVILGAPNRAVVLNDTQNFIKNNANIFQLAAPIKAGDVVGTYNVKWGKKVNVIAKEDISVLLTNKEEASVKISLPEINKPVNKGDDVGTITVTNGLKETTTSAVLSDSISAPSFVWKLLHP